MKLRRRGLLLIALAVMLPAAAQADSSFGRFHALVIGNQNYRHLTKLQTPLADAKEVAEVLKTQYGFTVDLLLDKSRDEIKLALSELRKTITDERDNLLIYYAGHGYLDERTSTGYWQPVDAEKDNDVYWLPTDEISRLLKAVRARHVLIVADSCYSGSLLMRDSGARLPAAVGRDEWLKRMQATQSRNALTSGRKEPVVDGGGDGHSVFAQALLDALRGNKEILDGQALFNLVKGPIVANARQTPLYGIIYDTNHKEGDFLFVPRKLQESGVQQVESSAKTNLNSFQNDGGDKQLQSIEKQRQDADSQEEKTIGQYVDHGDGTITDTKIGVMWKRCAEGLYGVNCENGKMKEYKWDDAVQRFKNVEYAGYADWRLPIKDELKTLVYCSKGKNKKGNWCNDESERPTINQQAFPNTEATWFWSGSPHAAFSDYAWYVDFSLGYSLTGSRDLNYAVRLVRDGDSTATPPTEKTVAKQPPKEQPKQGDPMTDLTTGMEFIYVPGGCFMMGSPENDKEHQNDEEPIHKVCVDGFWIGKYEVTQEQWMKITNNNPAEFKKGDDYPVENVSWNDAQKFIEKLNGKSGKQFRLPTEAEWEYACRAGGTGKYCGGDDVDAVAWYSDNSGGISHPIGGKQKNGFGLYDMSGNVWEWCMDWYEDGYYAFSSKENPPGPSNGSFRVIRGGGWFHTHRDAKAVNRRNNSPGYRDNSHGFRLVLPLQTDGR